MTQAKDLRSAKPAEFRGEWIAPGDSAYDEARGVYNLCVDAHPAVVARCASTADVVSAVRFARAHELPLTVRCTGYSLGGFSVGPGLVVDLSLMRTIEIDAERRVARVQGGMRGGDLQTEAARFGLAGPTGVASGTGIGLHLGGGVGHMMARIGYGADNILAFELVTADGEVVQASPEENPDLFWAVRGTTGNFGVVTALELQLYDVPSTVLFGRLAWPLDQMHTVWDGLRGCFEWPDNLSYIPTFSSAAVDDRAGLDVLFCHCGAEDQARADLELLRGLGEPALEEVRTMTFRDCHFVYDDDYPPSRLYMDEQPVDSISDELVDAMVGLMGDDPGAGLQIIEVLPRRGALQRDPLLPSALRDTGEKPTWGVLPGVWWEDPAEDERHLQWVSKAMSVVQSIGPTNGAKHPNGPGVHMEPEAVAAMYGDRFDRLRAIKRQWDPDNVFRGAQNIPPADG